MPKDENVSDMYLWHYRLSHINQNRINKMRGKSLLEVSDSDSLPTYESCLFGKMIRSSFTGKGEWASGLLSLIHTDVCRPMTVSARGGYRCFITFTDDLSRYGYIFLMRHKSESFEISNDTIMKWKNKSKRVLKSFDLIGVVNTSLVSLWHTLRRMGFSLSGLLLEDLN